MVRVMRNIFIILLIVFFSYIGFAHERLPNVRDIETQDCDSSNSSKCSLSNMLPDMDILKDYPKTENIRLMVFVSSSMPTSMLKYYLKEVNKYGGTLIFNGLIEGSFVKTKEFAMGLTDEEKDEAAMQVNDEAFLKYNISSVPSIVLAVEKDCYQEQTCIELSDKINGSVKLEYALREFAEKGETASFAAQLLKGSL
ncbi:MAG: hypothetical protein K0R02_708 [Rickettsiaceae bacterium]|jgi:type-F conjugative transfer system pilin assembly protein TrbC|nr:hypothetical protein [Rickettsiaceae bacterium]